MTKKEKIQKYEELLHKIQMCAEVTMDNEKLKRLISNICGWSYAHRAGDGMLTERQIKKNIKEKFNKLTEC